MKIEKIQCDVNGCENDGAQKFQIFKERKADGAGSMEDWFYVFDLCSGCQTEILHFLFEVERCAKTPVETALFTKFEIRVRVE